MSLKYDAGEASRHPLPSEEGTTEHVLTTLTRKPRPESGLGFLICAMFARQREQSGHRGREASGGRRSNAPPPLAVLSLFEVRQVMSLRVVKALLKVMEALAVVGGGGHLPSTRH